MPRIRQTLTDTRWSHENGGRGHLVDQVGVHVKSRKELKDLCQREGLVTRDGPMGGRVGIPSAPWTDKERERKIDKERSALAERAVDYASRR